MNSKRTKAYLLLLAVSAIWGFAAIVIKLTLAGITPIPFLTYRFFISAIIGVVSLKNYKKILRLPKAQLVGIVLYALFSTTFALGFLFLGLDKTTVLNLTLLTLVTPLLMSWAGVIFFKEHITHRERIGTAIAFFGTILTVIEPIIESGTNFGALEGNLLVIAYMLFDIASVIILKKLLRDKVPAEDLTHISFIIGFITIIPIALVTMGLGGLIYTLAATPLPYHLGVIYMALFSGTVAYFLRAKAQKTIEVSEASLFAYLTSVFSAPLAVIFLHEKITFQFLIGAVIIAVGVFIAEYKRRNNLQLKT